MKDDHETRLATLAEKLAEVFLVEADPGFWPGAGKTPVEQTKDERGDRAWTLKGANQLGLLFARALELRTRVRYQLKVDAGFEAEPPREAGLAPFDGDADIKRFEVEAKQLLDLVIARRGK